MPPCRKNPINLIGLNYKKLFTLGEQKKLSWYTEAGNRELFTLFTDVVKVNAGFFASDMRLKFNP